LCALVLFGFLLFNSHPRIPQQSKAFVVARYKENTTWLHCLEFTGVESFVYEKQTPANSHSRVSTAHHIYVENIGYECSSYAKYIVDHYDDLPDRVYFVQGFPFEHCPGFSTTVAAIENEDFFMLSDFNSPFRSSGWPHFWPHQGFGEVFSRMYRALFNTEPPTHLQTYFNGQFMASRQTIHRHPREFYQTILDLVTTQRDMTRYSWGNRGDGWLEVCLVDACCVCPTFAHAPFAVWCDGAAVAKGVYGRRCVSRLCARACVL
jgi:hypothetical protein